MRHSERSFIRRGTEAIAGAVCGAFATYTGLLAVLSLGDAMATGAIYLTSEKQPYYSPMATEALLPPVIQKEIHPYSSDGSDRMAFDMLFLLGAGSASAVSGISGYGLLRNSREKE